MSKKKHHEEEHVDETWLLPYSDMLTLLLALFIVMFAMSQVDQQKMQQISEQFNIVFAGGKSIMQGGGSDGKSSISLVDNGTSDIKVEQDKMVQLETMLKNEIKQKGYGNKVAVSLDGEGLQISIQDEVLFNSGQAEILSPVRPLLLDISSMIKNLDNNIKFVGHTDDVPINNSKYRSNWELSAVRAINVMNYMVKYGNVKADKSSIQAYGEYKPKFTNSTAIGRAKNRRVEIFIIRKYPLTKKTNN